MTLLGHLRFERFQRPFEVRHRAAIEPDVLEELVDELFWNAHHTTQPSWVESDNVLMIVAAHKPRDIATLVRLTRPAEPRMTRATPLPHHPLVSRTALGWGILPSDAWRSPVAKAAPAQTTKTSPLDLFARKVRARKEASIEERWTERLASANLVAKPATPDNGPELVDFLAEQRAKTVDPTVLDKAGYDSPGDLDEDIRRFEENYGSVDGQVRGLLLTLRNKEGALVGTAAVTYNTHPTEGTGRWGEIRKMYLREQYRGFGLASAALDLLIRQASDARVERLRLDTLVGMNAATRLYESRGFSRVEGPPQFLCYELGLGT